MRSRTKALLRRIAFGVGGLGFILYFVAYLLPYWSKYKQPGTNIEFRYGLFLTCIKDSFKSVCNFIHLTVVYGSWVRVVQVVGGIALAFYFGAVITSFFAFYWKGRCKKTLLYSSATSGFAAGILIAVTVFLYANSNESQQDSLDFGFYFAIISIVPILIGGILNVFNGKQVIIPDNKYVEKKKKERMDKARENIIEAMINMSPEMKSQPPLNTMILLDQKDTLADDYPDDDGARPGPSTDPGYRNVSFDYDTDAEVDNMLDILGNEDRKSEDDFVESDDEGFGSQEKEQEEEKPTETVVEVFEEKPKEHVTFVEELPVKSEIPKPVLKKKKQDFRGTKSASIARKRLAHKQQKVAIMKVDCGKCPWEHTMMKFVDDLTEIDIPNVVKYIEGAENVAAYMLGIGREECFQQQYNPLDFALRSEQEKEREWRRVDRRLKEEERKKMQMKQKKEFEKIKSALKITTPSVEDSVRATTAKTEKSIAFSDKTILPPIEPMSESSRSSSEASLSITEDNRSITKSFSMSTTRLDEEKVKQKMFDDRLDKLYNEYNEKSSRASFTTEKSGRSREASSKTVSTKPMSSKTFPLETFAETETIVEDTYEGPGLSDDEDERTGSKYPLKSALRDHGSASTRMTFATGHTEASHRTMKASARTYASSNATTLLPRPVTVVFKGLHDSEPREEKRKRVKRTVKSTAFSKTGRSNKSATGTRERKAAKERRVAVVKQECRRCPWENKALKYEEDLTEDEMNMVERVFDRSIENLDKQGL